MAHHSASSYNTHTPEILFRSRNKHEEKKIELWTLESRGGEEEAAEQKSKFRLGVRAKNNFRGESFSIRSVLVLVMAGSYDRNY